MNKILVNIIFFASVNILGANPHRTTYFKKDLWNQFTPPKSHPLGDSE